MKKTFPVHIGGKIYYFDDDAYQRLNDYYRNLRQSFTGEDGAEIVGDIECRVADIIADNHPETDYAIVTLEEVDSIIMQVGQPEQLAPHAEDAPETASTGRRSVPPPYNGPTDTASAARELSSEPPRKRLYRDPQNKVIAGVLSGLAYYWSVNITALRVIVVIVAIFVTVWPVVILYAVGWLLIPAADTPRQKLEMMGSPVTVDSVGRTTILGTPEPNSNRVTSNDFWSTLFRIVSVVVMSFVGIIGLVVGLAMIILLIAAVAGIISYAGWHSMHFVPDPGNPVLSLLALMFTCFVWLIPAVAAIWASASVIFKAPGLKRRTAIQIAVVELILIITVVTMCTLLSDQSIFHIHFPR